MILYFSATGNSKFVAEKLAKSLGDRALCIEESKGGKEYEKYLATGGLSKKGLGKDGLSEEELRDAALLKEVIITKGECFGLVTPTHFLQLPTLVKAFLEKTKFTVESGAYTYLVATCGMTPGFVAEEARRVLAKKGVTLCASFSVKMCDTWTPVFNLNDKVKVQKTNERAKIKIEKVQREILARKKGNRTNFRLPYFTHIAADKVFEKARATKNFFTEDSCTACALCEKECPEKAIKIEAGRPHWKKESCAICLRCLHHCPQFAIQYGDGKTKEHGQYKGPQV